MQLEIITLSELNQPQKDKYRMFFSFVVCKFQTDT